MANKIVPGADYLALPSTPSTWLIEPLLPSGGALLIYGEAKIGKSFAALQLADAIVAGTSWMGFPTRKGKVAYIQLDTPRSVWQERIRLLQRAGEMLDLPALADRETLNAWPFNILNPEHLIMLRDELQPLEPDLVIIDTLREAHQADENDSTQMQAAIAALVAATEPAALCLVSHARKPSQEGDFSLMADNRGSNYVVGRMDAIVRFTPRSARISGRSIEEHTISLERADSGFWDAHSGEYDTPIDLVLADPSLTSVRSKAKVLAGVIGKSESACRALIRRRMVRGGGPQLGKRPTRSSTDTSGENEGGGPFSLI